MGMGFGFKTSCLRRMAWGMLGMGPTYGLTIVHPDGVQLQKIADLISQGKVKPVLDKVFPLEQAACAPGTESPY